MSDEEDSPERTVYGKNLFEVEVADRSVGAERLWADWLEMGDDGRLLAYGGPRPAGQGVKVSASLLWMWAPGAWWWWAQLDPETEQPLCRHPRNKQR